MNNTVLNSSNGSASNQHQTPFSKGYGWAILLVHAAEILIGFPKNLRVCTILYKRKDLRKVPHILLGNLSIIGLLVCGMYIPLRLAIDVTDQFLHKPVHGGFCVARASSSLFFFGLQTMTLVAMGTDRQDCVVRPFKRRLTVFNVRKVLTGIWSVAGLTTAVHLILAVNDYGSECYVKTKRKATSVSYLLAIANIYLFGTVIIIFTTFVRIVKKLRSSPFAESNQNFEFKVTRFSYMLLFIFVISWIPISSFGVFIVVTGSTSPTIEGMKSLALAVSNCNYVVNPVIHMNILKAAQRAEAPAKPRNEDHQQNERPGTVWIEEQAEISEIQLQNAATQLN